MFEVTLLLLAMLLVAACAFLPWGLLFPQQADSACACELQAPEASPIKQSFLSYLQSEIESSLFPRPTDSVLQRHYDTLVNAELENRLAAMPDT